nr:hypothetical protein CFP56_00538 [Quercus suber]
MQAGKSGQHACDGQASCSHAPAPKSVINMFLRGFQKSVRFRLLRSAAVDSVGNARQYSDDDDDGRGDAEFEVISQFRRGGKEEFVESQEPMNLQLGIAHHGILLGSMDPFHVRASPARLLR